MTPRTSTLDHPPLTLGIETSGFGGSVALVQCGNMLAQRDLDPTGRRHARTLVPEIRLLLDNANKSLRELELVAVSIGPGSFTGLRVGVVCAKTLAWAADARIVAVDTYLAIAHAAPAEIECMQVVGDGQRGDLYVGHYQRDDRGDWIRSRGIAIHPAEAWLAGLKKTDVVTGPGLERHAETAAPLCHVVPRELWSPLASTIALLGAQQLASMEAPDDVRSLEPFYLRKSGAEEKAEKAG